MDQVVLLTTPQAVWPDPILRCGFPQRDPETFVPEAGDQDAAERIVLGYTSPVHCLQTALLQDPTADLDDLPDRWRRAAEALLRIRLSDPSRCRLLNLPLLSAPDLLQLQAFWGPDQSALTPVDPAPASPVREPAAESLAALVGLVISQRPDLLELYSDLEVQADLFGREPDLRWVRPGVADPALALALLRDWQRLALRQREQAAEQEERADALTAAQRDSRDLRERIADLEDALARTQLEAERRRPSQEADNAVPVAAEVLQALQEAREERDLLVLQLQQLEEELSPAFASQQQAGAQSQGELEALQQRDRLQEELQAVQQQRDQSHSELQTVKQQRDELQAALQGGQQESVQLQALRQQNQQLLQELQELGAQCRYLFLHSQVQESLDRSRIGRILDLVRQSLRA